MIGFLKKMAGLLLIGLLLIGFLKGTIGFLILILIICLAIWQREHLLSSQWNNKILLFFWLFCLCLFFNAIYQGGGEPIGLKALKKISKPDKQEVQKNPYYESMRGFISPQDFISPVKPDSNLTAKIASVLRTKFGTWFWSETWFWWWLWFYSLIIAIAYIPFAFWDEVVAAWHREQERREQRLEIIDLRPPVVETAQSHGETSAPASRAPRPETRFSRFKERIAAAFSADMLWDLTENIFKKFLGDRIFGRG